MVLGAVAPVVTHLLLGTAAYQTVATVRAHDEAAYGPWLMYWIVASLFPAAELFGDVFISWLPMYYDAKVLFLVWLTLPRFGGGRRIYEEVLAPYLEHYEEDIDAHIEVAKAHASTQALSAASGLLRVALNKSSHLLSAGQRMLAQGAVASVESSLLSAPPPVDVDALQPSLRVEELPPLLSSSSASSSSSSSSSSSLNSAPKPAAPSKAAASPSKSAPKPASKGAPAKEEPAEGKRERKRASQKKAEEAEQAEEAEERKRERAAEKKPAAAAVVEEEEEQEEQEVEAGQDRKSKRDVEDRALSDPVIRVFVDRMTAGVRVKKHGRQGRPRIRSMRLDDELSTLVWDSQKGETLSLRAVTGVVRGKTTAVFDRAPATCPEANCLSLLSDERSVDIEVPSTEARDVLYAGFRHLVRLNRETTRARAKEEPPARRRSARGSARKEATV